jgi:hypothetical protein
MGIKYIHVVLILVSIGLSIGFALWTLNHHDALSSYCSFAVAVGLIVYCVSFIRKMKAL